MKLRAAVCMTALALALGCAPVDDGAATGALTIPDECLVRGIGLLPTGDFAAGRVRGDDVSASGHWLHASLADGIVLATPDWLLCRLNGATLADFGGSATLNGDAGYTYRVSVQDRGTPGAPTILEGVPTVETVTATRHRHPARFEDGHLTVSEDRARVTIPAELPVIEGEPGTGLAKVTFDQAGLPGATMCLYRGNGSHGRGGDRYVLHHCASFGPSVSAGDTVDVTWLRVRVYQGAASWRRAGTRTTVSVNFDVTPLTVVEPPRDHYRIAVFDPSGAEAFSTDGDLVRGDFEVVDVSAP